MTASHRGGPGDGPPDIAASGRWRGHNDRPAGLTAARRRVAAMAAVAVVLAAGWAGRDYITGSWRYWIEHSSPLTPGLLCPTYPARPCPARACWRPSPTWAAAFRLGLSPGTTAASPHPASSIPAPRAAAACRTAELACARGRARPGPGRSRTRRPAGHDRVGHDGVDRSHSRVRSQTSARRWRSSARSCRTSGAAIHASGSC